MNNKYVTPQGKDVHIVDNWKPGWYLMSDGSVIDQKTLDKWKVKEEKE